MKRRTVLAFLSAASGLLALPAFGQKRMPRVAFFSPAAEDVVAVWAKGFHEALGGLRYENGRNIVLEVVMGAFSRERTDQLAAELIASRPAIIVTPGFAAVLLAGLTKEIPIVTAYSGDLVDSGLAKSLARPGGNVTGVQLLDLELVGKRVEILKEIMPRLERLAVVASPLHPGEPRERNATVVAAQRLGIAVSYHPVKNASELEGGSAAQGRCAGDRVIPRRNQPAVSRKNRGIRVATQDRDRVRLGRLCSSRPPRLLWSERARNLWPPRALRRSDPERRRSGFARGRTADNVSTDGES